MTERGNAAKWFIRTLMFWLFCGLMVMTRIDVARASEARTDMIVRSSDGVNLAVHEWGERSKPTIIFIHGYLQSYLSWERQFAPLSKNFHVVAFDMRGHGASDKPLDTASYRENWRWADDVNAVIRATGASKPILVGWSMGGRVVLDYVEKYGQNNVAGFIFVDSGLKRGPAMSSNQNAGLISDLASPELDRSIAGSVAFLHECFNIQPEPDEFARMLAYNMLVPPPVRVFLAGRALEFDEALAGLKKPTLVIHGKKDALVTQAASEYTAGQVPGAKLKLYDNAGHSPFFEVADRFNADVAKFVSSVKED